MTTNDVIYSLFIKIFYLVLSSTNEPVDTLQVMSLAHIQLLRRPLSPKHTPSHCEFTSLFMFIRRV